MELTSDQKELIVDLVIRDVLFKIIKDRIKGNGEKKNGKSKNQNLQLSKVR
jgi:hypothetical protein